MPLKRSLEAQSKGRDSSVGIPTRYVLDGPGIESLWGRDFPQSSIPTLGPTQPPIQWVPGLYWGGKAAGAWRWQSTPSGPTWPVVGRTSPSPRYAELFCCNCRWMVVITTDSAYCGVAGRRGRAASTVPVNWFGRLLLWYRIWGEYVYVRYRLLAFRKLNKAMFAVRAAVLL
jgi:hypothetical protein